MSSQEAVERAKQLLTADRADCRHVLADSRTFRCPGCHGIMRRCCQSILGWPHEHDCVHG